MRTAVAVVALCLVTAACGAADTESQRVRSSPEGTSPVETFEPDGSPTPQVTATPDSKSSARISTPETPVPPSPTPSSLADVNVKLTRVASLDEPLAMDHRDGNDDLWIAQKGGTIVVVRNGQVAATVLDISSEVSGGSEQGLLGIAFSPDEQYLYVNFTNGSGDTVIREYRVSGSTLSSPRQVLFVDQPDSNHNGGNLAFGPDDRLYVGLGDGGGSGDPRGNAQNRESLLGKMLRIDPRPSGGDEYGIPSDNPFVGRAGRDEIWAYGLRNPWRYSFDRQTGDLYIGDVGQNSWEEVDYQASSSDGGENYGWDRLEGTHRYEGNPPSEHVLPIFEYPRSDGRCSVTGGYVYRGSRIADLRGAYVFADFCKGELRALAVSGGRVTDDRRLGPSASNIASFGEDRRGELYVLSLEGGLFRLDPA